MSTEKKLNRSPRLGALLRVAAQAMSEQLAAWLASSEYADLQPAHSAAISPLWEYPGGLRITALAQASRITKQSMSVLVDHLDKCGYVERVADPHDARATIIRLSARGRELGHALRACSKRVEADWGERIGADRVDALIDILEALRTLLDEPPTQRHAPGNGRG